MDRSFALAEKIAARLIERKQTVAVAEGSAGGLISAALLAVPGASAYFVSGAVVYTGAAGPTGNRYGDPAGHTCIAVSGPSERAATLRTGGSDRRSNMQAFTVRALEIFAEQLG